MSEEPKSKVIPFKPREAFQKSTQSGGRGRVPPRAPETGQTSSNNDVVYYLDDAENPLPKVVRDILLETEIRPDVGFIRGLSMIHEDLFSPEMDEFTIREILRTKIKEYWLAKMHYESFWPSYNNGKKQEMPLAVSTILAIGEHAFDNSDIYSNAPEEVEQLLHELRQLKRDPYIRSVADADPVTINARFVYLMNMMLALNDFTPEYMRGNITKGDRVYNYFKKAFFKKAKLLDPQASELEKNIQKLTNEIEHKLDKNTKGLYPVTNYIVSQGKNARIKPEQVVEHFGFKNSKIAQQAVLLHIEMFEQSSIMGHAELGMKVLEEALLPLIVMKNLGISVTDELMVMAILLDSFEAPNIEEALEDYFPEHKDKLLSYYDAYKGHITILDDLPIRDQDKLKYFFAAEDVVNAYYHIDKLSRDPSDDVFFDNDLVDALDLIKNTRGMDLPNQKMQRLHYETMAELAQITHRMYKIREPYLDMDAPEPD